MRSKVLLLLTGVLALVGVIAVGERLESLRQARRAPLPPVDFRAGQAFPNLTLPSAEDGRPVSLADFRGEKLILHVFASW